MSVVLEKDSVVDYSGLKDVLSAEGGKKHAKSGTEFLQDSCQKLPGYRNPYLVDV